MRLRLLNNKRVINKEEELGCFELLKNNFPELNGGSLVMGLYDLLNPEINFQNFICINQTAKEAVIPYIQGQQPYIVLDESEGYKCLFLRGHFIRAHYDVSRQVMLRFIEESEPTPSSDTGVIK